MSNSNLKEVLKVKPSGVSLVHSLNNIKSRAELLLSKIVETFPDYTTHDIRHSEEVLKNLNWIIPNILMEKLNTYEIYFLIIAAYLHDIGMVRFSELDKRNNIRENHHLRAEEFIVNNFKDLMIEDEHQARIIGRICRGHRKENIHNRELFKPDIMYKNESINIPLLADFLRIADELDFTFERAPLIIYEHIPPRDTISKEEWERHLNISGVGLSPEDPLLIKCSAICKNHDIHRALKRLETKINKELEYLPNHLHQYRDFRKDMPRIFLIEIEAKGYKFYDFKFSLQEKEIINLLMGDKLYKRREESLRELLKNSVDGCRLRRELLKKRRLSYNPEIIFELTPDKERIIVADNGVGMNEDIIERYFTKIGESFYKSPEFLEEELDLTPVSELGIGILSCFMIANKIVVETKTDDSDPLLIEIDDFTDYFFVREGERKDTGTTVTLFLKDNIIAEIDLEKEIKYYARHLEFPIKVILPTRKESIIMDVGFKPNLEVFFSKWLDESFGFLLIKIDYDYVEGVIAILFKKDNKIGLKPAKWQSWLDTEVKLEERLFISNEGIFVDNVNILLYYFNLDYFIIDLNLKRNALDLNIARNDIVRNDKFDKFTKQIEEILLKNIGNFLNTLEKKCTKCNVDAIKLTNIFFAEYICTWKLDDLMKENKLSDKFIHFIKGFYYFKCISEKGISYIKYNKIIEMGRVICILLYLDDYSIEHINQIFFNCSGFDKNKLYLLLDYPSRNIVELLFEDMYIHSFILYLDMEKSDELKGLIPKTWKLVKFKNYETSRLMEFCHYNTTIININNKFINLLINGKDIIKGDKKLAVKGFFRTLKLEIKSDFQKVIMDQKAILKWFANSDLINKDEINNYLLTKKDFPPHLFKVQ